MIPPQLGVSPAKAARFAPMIPPQLGVSPAKAARFETPPSSFDESDGFLSDTVKHLSNTTRLQPLAYKTAADQKVGLLTKLLGNFPEYAELLVRSGRVQKSKKADISSRPIHVFIDISNVSLSLSHVASPLMPNMTKDYGRAPRYDENLAEHSCPYQDSAYSARLSKFLPHT
jgi:hypothetical protein